MTSTPAPSFPDPTWLVGCGNMAGALLLPYLTWLCLATALNYETGRLNPGADSHPLGLTGGK